MTTRLTGCLTLRSVLSLGRRAAMRLALVLCAVACATAVHADDIPLALDADSVFISDSIGPFVEAVPSPLDMMSPDDVMLADDYGDDGVQITDAYAQGCGAHDVWIVDTRATFNTCCTPAAAAKCVRFARLDSCRWVTSSLEEYLATLDETVPTIVWVHGNNSDPEDARNAGWKMYQLLNRCSCGPMRFVIWSWPSERLTTFAVPDVRLKADVSERQGYYLAWFLDRMPPQANLNIIGYSYGTRVSSSALHMLGGGTIQRCSLPDRLQPDRAPVRAFFMAAAQDADGFAPWGRYRCAVSQMTDLVVLVNRCDFVLRYYPRLEQPGGPPALGSAGLSGIAAARTPRPRVRQINVSDDIHTFHAYRHYVGSAVIAGHLRRFAAEAQTAIP